MSGITGKSESRAGEPPTPAIDCYRGQHLDLAERQIATELGRTNVTVDESESLLAWLARRRGRNGRALIEPHQFQAGERLRADFTCAHIMPRTTSNWSSPISSGRRGAGGERAAAFTETMIAARQRVHQALDAAGPEFGGLLLDVCFSNRPFGVKHFQTIHHCSVDVAHGLVLLFGIGTKALPLWDSRTRRNNLLRGLAVRLTIGPSGHANSSHPSSREGHHSTARWSSGFLLSHLIL
jgi:hypothetical protein